MNNLSVRRALSGLLCTILIGLSSSLYAQVEAGAVPAASLTQGQAAVVMARQLGLFNGSAAPTQAQAIQLLSARDIAPAGGWDSEELLNAGDLARMLVYALGLEEELGEEQLASADNDAFIDLLIEEYGVDVNEIANANDFESSAAFDSGSVGDSSTDPLDGPPLDDVSSDDSPVVDSADLDATLAAIIGGAAGGGGALAGEDEEAICAVISGIVGTPGNCVPAAP